MKLKNDAKQPKVIILMAVVLACCVLLVANLYASRPVHCVSAAIPDNAAFTSSDDTGYKCFHNQAEAIFYATGGQIQLPANASSIEIDAALRAAYDTEP